MFTLSTGLEIITDVTDETPTYVVAKRPLVITPVPQGNDTYGLAFMPYSPADPEGSSRVYFTNIVSEAVEVPAELIKAYVSRTSNIEIASSLASASSIIGGR
jgi:hypothetical protein